MAGQADRQGIKFSSEDNRAPYGNQNRRQETCKRGHPFSGDNLYIIPSTGQRQCRKCRREVHDKREREAIRQRMGLPPADPYRGRYAIPRP